MEHGQAISLADSAVPTATAKRLDMLPEVVASLPQSVNCSMKATYREFVAGDGQFDIEVVGYELGPVDADSLAAAREAVERLGRPLPEREIVTLLGRLRMMTKIRTEEQDDIKLALKVYAMELAEFPGAVVRHVLKTQPGHCKWWPAWEELLLRLEYHKRRLGQLEAALRRAG